MQTVETFACPKCHILLQESSSTLICPQCGSIYRMREEGVFDLRIDQTEYKDWMSASPQAMASYLIHVSPTEMAGARHMVRNYLHGVLKYSSIPPQGKILSIGCGGGWDVGELLDMGYKAWGVDNGSRYHLWEKHDYKKYLSLADALHLPFIDNYFDFSFAEGVIEHIGCDGDGFLLKMNWKEDRQMFVDSLIRVTKPGGVILIACPNKLFPVDFYHGGKSILGIMMRFHSPRENFLLSFKDIKSFLNAKVEDLTALTLKNFFNLRSNLYDGYIRNVIFRIADFTFGLLPDSIWNSPLSPYIVVLARKSGNK